MSKLIAIGVTPAQVEALAEWLDGTDATESDEVRLSVHAGGNLRGELVSDRGSGTVVADVEFDVKGEAWPDA